MSHPGTELCIVLGLITHTVLHSALSLVLASTGRVTGKFATPFVMHEKEKKCLEI